MKISFRWILLLPAFIPTCINGFCQVREVIPNLIDQFTNVRDFTMTADSSQAYFTAQSPLGELSAIIRVDNNEGQWTDPRLAAFSGKYSDLEPFLTPDGQRLYFVSNRPFDLNDTISDYDIWFVERKDRSSPWSEPKNIGSPVNSTANEFYPVVTESGNLYFTSDEPSSKGNDDIFICRYENGSFLPPESLGAGINTEGYEFNAYVSPNEQYMLFTGYNRDDGLGSGDIYISYRLNDNHWTDAINLGPKVNSAKMDYCPFVDNLSHFLYFTSKRNNFDESTEGFSTLSDFLETINSYQNGLSRLYRVSFKPPNIPK